MTFTDEQAGKRVRIMGRARHEAEKEIVRRHKEEFTELYHQLVDQRLAEANLPPRIES